MHAPSDVRGRGRPQQFDSDALLEAVVEVFWKRGYENTSTRDLESELGVSQSSLYNKFGSKQKLLESALDRYETLTNDAVLLPLIRSDKGLPAIECFFEDLTRWVMSRGKRGCMLINMMAEDGGNSKSISLRTKRYRQNVKSALLTQLEVAVKQKQIASGNLDVKASLLLGLVLGFNIAARGGAGKSELGEMLESVNAQIREWNL